MLGNSDYFEVSVICLIFMPFALLIVFQLDEPDDDGKSGEEPTIKVHTLTNTKCVESLLVVHLIVLMYCSSLTEQNDEARNDN